MTQGFQKNYGWWVIIYNFNEDLPKTNNAIEASHLNLQKSFYTSQLSIPILIEKLRDEEDVIRIREIRRSNSEIFKRHKKYTNLENNLKEKLSRSVNNNFGYRFVMEIVDLLSYTNPINQTNNDFDENN